MTRHTKFLVASLSRRATSVGCVGRHSLEPDEPDSQKFTLKDQVNSLGSFGIPKADMCSSGRSQGSRAAKRSLGASAPAAGEQSDNALHTQTRKAKPKRHDPLHARRILAAVLTIAGIATFLALVVLWPSGEAPKPEPGFLESQSSAAESVTGTVVEHTSGACSSPDAGRVFTDQPRISSSSAAPGASGTTGASKQECGLSIVELTSGPDEGKRTLIETSGMPGEAELAEGDKIVLAIHRPSSTGIPGSSSGPSNSGTPGSVSAPVTEGTPQQDSAAASADTNTYTFLDLDRHVSIWLWLGAAVILIAVVGMARGLLSLVGLGITLAAMMGFLVPALLRGGDPVALAITTGAAILFPVLFLVHGINWKSASALAGTLTSMVLAAGLANLAISTSQLRGLGNEDNLLIQLYLPEVSVTGLMLAGFIIGALGVLNDVTIAQASTVQELYDAAPKSRPIEVFRSAMRVGRDHIASMVYTLVLAYLGTALPLSILLSVSGRPLMQSLTSDVVATEVLRSVIGAVALVLAVPITTLIAAYTVAPEAWKPPKRSQEELSPISE